MLQFLPNQGMERDAPAVAPRMPGRLSTIKSFMRRAIVGEIRRNVVNHFHLVKEG